MIFSNKIIQNFIESVRYATTTSMHNKGCKGMSGEQLANIWGKREKIKKENNNMVNIMSLIQCYMEAAL